jgi:uncharacterized protein YndB with AHSA1/START domain
MPIMGRTDTASRVLDAEPQRIYAALVDPDALLAWLPPAGMTARFERFDVVEARVLDLVPGVRVVQAVDFVSDDPRFAGTMTMTWELSRVEGGTTVEIRADDVPDGISAEDHAAGLTSSLENLAAYLDG